MVALRRAPQRPAASGSRLSRLLVVVGWLGVALLTLEVFPKWLLSVDLILGNYSRNEVSVSESSSKLQSLT